MGKSHRKDFYDDYEGAERAFTEMDRRDARSRKRRQRDPEGDVEAMPTVRPVYPSMIKRNGH